jgi:hypothetical protein
MGLPRRARRPDLVLARSPVPPLEFARVKVTDLYPWGDMNEATTRAIPGYPGYRADEDGSIWSNRTGVWRRLKQRAGTRGYLLVCLCICGTKETRLVHRLILLSWVGQCPDGMEACHGDGNRANNRRDNLRWDTPQNNWTDRKRHGKGCEGEKNAGAKVTAADVHAIRRRAAAGETQANLGKAYGLSNPAIGDIVCRRSWRHLETESAA